MKKLPENEFWKRIKNRLANYEEDPGDDWNAIAGALASGESSSKKWSRGIDTFSITMLIVLATIMNFRFSTPATANNKTISQSRDLKESISNGVQPKTHSTTSITTHKNKKQERIQTKEIKPEQTVGLTGKPDAIEAIATTSQVLNVVEKSGGMEQTIEGDTLSSDKRGSLYEKLPQQTEEVKSEKKKRKFRPAWYFNIAPSFTYQKVIPVKNDDVNILEVNNGGMVSSNRFSTAFEVGFQMQLSNDLQLYSGLSYYQQHQVFSYTYSNGSITVNPTSEQFPSEQFQYAVEQQILSKRFDYKMRNIGGSVGILYYLHGQRLMHKMGGGLLFQQGLSGGKESYNNASSTYISYQLLYRLEFMVSSRINLFGQPTFTRSILSKESLSEPLHLRPYRAGLSVGIVYHF